MPQSPIPPDFQWLSPGATSSLKQPSATPSTNGPVPPDFQWLSAPETPKKPQEPSSPWNKFGETQLGALTIGVTPDVFGQRILGAIGSVVNTLFPGGDVRRPEKNKTPALTPEQEIGAKMATVGALGSIATRGLGLLSDRMDIPSRLMMSAADDRAAAQSGSAALRTARNAKASIKENLARAAAGPPEPVGAANDYFERLQSQEYIPPEGPKPLPASNTFFQGAGDQGTQVSFARPTAPKALPPAPTAPPQLTGSTAPTQGLLALNPAPGTIVPRGTTGIPIPSEPALPTHYAQMPVESPAPPGTVGQINLGQEGGIPLKGEQTVTGTRVPTARNDLGQFRRMTREEAIIKKGNIGRTAAETPQPTPPPRPNVKAHAGGK